MRLDRLALLLALSACGPAAGSGDERPNLLLILADDLGWKDVRYNGSAYATPCLDRLAASGTRFDQAYAASPCCSPTRASLLSGFHPARLRLTRAIRISDVNDEGPPERERKWLAPESSNHLPADPESLAWALSAAGYDTGFVGKWHLGLPPHSPKGFGFASQEAVGYHSACPYFAPYNSFLEVPEAPLGESLTERLTDEALRFIERDRERPFFLMLSHFAVHAPWQARPEDEARWRDALEPDTPQSNPTYASMIEGLDESVGRIVDALDAGGLREKTLVVLHYDNGPTEVKGKRRLTSTAPLRGGKLELYEGGIRVPMIASWPGTIDAGAVSERLVSSLDLYPTFLSLAGVENARNTDGVDLSGAWHGGEWPPRDTLYFHFPHRSFTSAIRKGDLKLIHHQRGGEAELYDLAGDIGESNDLAAERPRDVARLEGELLEQLHGLGAAFPVRKD